MLKYGREPNWTVPCALCGRGRQSVLFHWSCLQKSVFLKFFFVLFLDFM